MRSVRERTLEVCSEDCSQSTLVLDITISDLSQTNMCTEHCLQTMIISTNIESSTIRIGFHTPPPHPPDLFRSFPRILFLSISSEILNIAGPQSQGCGRHQKAGGGGATEAAMRPQNVLLCPAAGPRQAEERESIEPQRPK